ncbi:MAG: hypothetical protein A3G18_05770 [Rhodospirillales bacterium RIFCSPLOWO2_12_FULL_58_28]|nr:MAG: hypothetical protein A3H92_00075 [Rhodospirillales bacterium RIFCSPLOWO2_02_FULL_58_16]OHC79300.1 MAG: hypothetical protein A3G18_05770 [Rhodospirillales bacterium RIFCSPLOWO2_12_FULL_58_28]
MAIRKILVLLDGSDAAKPALDAAFMAGRNFCAHVDVVHVRSDPRDILPLLSDDVSGLMVEDMIGLADKEAGERAIRARRMFDEICARYAVAVTDEAANRNAISASWIEMTGGEDELSERRGRLVDLIVAGRPTADGDPSMTMNLHAAIFESGRLVLVAPPKAPVALGRKVAVSWNGSAQAARAVASAMPVIKAAEEVLILSAESERTSSGAASELAGYLAWHGVAALTKAVRLTARPVGEAILEECADAGIDVLVMGAYTHSRMRQLVLGGVTRHMLENAEISLLMAH